jgi:hypothetical protein
MWFGFDLEFGWKARGNPKTLISFIIDKTDTTPRQVCLFLIFCTYRPLRARQLEIGIRSFVCCPSLKIDLDKLQLINRTDLASEETMSFIVLKPLFKKLVEVQSSFNYVNF